MNAILYIHGLGGSCKKHFSEVQQYLRKADSFEAYQHVYFDYPTKKTNIGGDTQSLAAILPALATQINSLRAKCDEFAVVAYSQGGILLKECLLTCYPTGIENLSAIVFLACPHHGSNFSSAAVAFNRASEQTKYLSSYAPALMALDEKWQQYCPIITTRILDAVGILDKIANTGRTSTSESGYVQVYARVDHQTILHFDRNADLAKSVSDFVLEGAIPEGVMFGEKIAREFTPNLIQGLNEFGISVSKLTEDQFNTYIAMLQVGKVVLSGGAGTGKTLLIAEKATRLANAGYSCAIFCLNPYLATYLKRITANDHVAVYTLSDFIVELSGEVPERSFRFFEGGYNISESSLSLALETLANNERYRFTAVFVDEAQDFHQDHISFLELTLTSEFNGLFVLVGDPLQKTAIIENDFQKIISRFHLHQNCRNAGKVYDIVRRFNPEAPNVSEFVKAMGQIHATIDGDGFDTLGSVLRQAISDIGQRDLVIVSLCNDEFVRAKIHGKQFFQGTPEYWRPALEKLVKVFRDAVNFHINDFYAKQDVRREELLSIIGSIELPKFSSRAFFSKADVGQIYDYVGKVRNALPQLPRSRSHFYQWVVQGGAVRLARNPLLATKPRSAHARSMGSTLAPLFHRHLNTESLLASLNDQICSDAFYSEIPEPPKIYIYDPEKPYSAHCTSRMEDKAIQIPVYSLEQFKGLEADGVVLLCDQSDREVEQAMYVGASRAKFYLSIVASPKFRLRQPKLTDLWD